MNIPEKILLVKKYFFLEIIYDENKIFVANKLSNDENTFHRQ